MRAIISVYDKTGVIDFARGLHEMSYEIFSTGNTRKAIADATVPVRSISDITGFPEILDGRVKTLHPMIHGGILARRCIPTHMAEIAKYKIQTIEMVVSNLYPFVQTISKKGVTLEDALENIDIGGPTLIRAAAKNFPDVIVIIDPADYLPVLEKIRHGGLHMNERKKLAQKALLHVAAYDTAIAQYLTKD